MDLSNSGSNFNHMRTLVAVYQENILSKQIDDALAQKRTKSEINNYVILWHSDTVVQKVCFGFLEYI